MLYRREGEAMNFQLAAIILLVILYPLGFRMASRMARMGVPSRKQMLAEAVVLLLFLASFVYLLISSWQLFLIMLGSGLCLISGAVNMSIAGEMSQKARDIPEDYAYLGGRVKGTIFLSLIFFGGGIYLFVLSIMRSLG